MRRYTLIGLSVLSVKYPQTDFFLLQPPRTSNLLFGPSMGFEASRKALRYGYESTKQWLTEQGASLVRRPALIRDTKTRHRAGPDRSGRKDLPRDEHEAASATAPVASS